jgi:Zincin-like metallopeptidase
MVEMCDDDFERLVAEELDALPDDMIRGIENVAIVVESQPLGERPRLFGQYRGHPLTTRGVYGFGELPDRITLGKRGGRRDNPRALRRGRGIRLTASPSAAPRLEAILAFGER